jgi:putative ABC transport system permease protein
MNKLGFAGLVPIAHVDKVRRLDGVAAATPFGWFGGNYKGQQMPFAQFSVDPDSLFDVFAEYNIPDEQLEAFQNDRLGCVAHQGLAKQMGWKIGDRVPLQGTIYPVDLDLKLVGIYEGPGNTGSLFFSWDYLDEQLQAGAGFGGNAGSIYLKCKVSDEVAIVSEEIDAMFVNSENSTRTRTEAAFQRMFADMLGDVQTYIRYISAAVVFALALVAATAMSMSMRERTTEVAVLKAIGFTKTRVLAMVLGESTMIAVLGGLLGIAGGLGALHLVSSVPATAALFPIPVSGLIGPWLAGLALVAAGIGFASGFVPAVLASRLSVVDGLRRVV